MLIAADDWDGAGKPSSRVVTFMGDDGAEPYIDKLVCGGWREGETTIVFCKYAESISRLNEGNMINKLA